jgi:hypothetical protein
MRYYPIHFKHGNEEMEENQMDSNTLQFYTGLIACAKQLIESDAFKERHRTSKKAFSRNRTLTFPIMTLFLLNLVKRSMQDELDEFFKAIQNKKVAERVVTKSAFSQARRKLHYKAFIELTQTHTTYFYKHGKPHRWYDFRLLAIDGSMNDLPQNETVGNHFGVWHPQAGGTCAKARVSQMFDVLNKVTVDALIAPKSEGERELAAKHLVHVHSGDLLLMDRGYPAFWLFAAVLKLNAHFCARLTVSKWTTAQKFVASGKEDQYVLLHPWPAAKKQCEERDLPTDPIRVRLIRVELSSGEVEVLVTTLLDRTRFPSSLFQDLYHQRWPVEEDYEVLKSRIEVENWSGKSVQAVYQEFHAAIFTKNMTAILAQPAQQEVEQQSRSKKYGYQINITNLVSKMKDTIVYLLRDADILPLLQALWQQMVKTTEPIRTGRSFPRKKGVKRKRFSMSYKATR